MFPISNDNLYVGQAGNNFNGHVARVEYWNDALTNIKSNQYIINKNRSVFSKKLTSRNITKKMESSV